jgi:hypothetical protein
VSSSELCPHKVALLAQNVKQKTYFFVDRLQGGLIFQTVGLVGSYNLIADIRNHRLADIRNDVAQRIPGECGRLRVADGVIRKDSSAKSAMLRIRSWRRSST